MKIIIWKLKATYWYMKLTKTPMINSWQFAESLLEGFYDADISPEDAVREDLTYWCD